MSAMEPIYRHIEFCRGAKALWGKIESGRWDWLGVHPDGQFILGSPPASRLMGSLGLRVDRADAVAGEHGIRVQVPNQPEARIEWFATEDQAKEAFAEHVALHNESESPRLVRVQRIERGQLADDDVIVQRPSTYR
jgi:hypothetical protein